MGVSGCGKSTVGQMLAHAMGLPFVEGDSLHSARNIQLMAAGTPLTDEDRQGWLHEVAAQLADATVLSRGVVISCSALKRSYRDVLRAAAPTVRFVHLHGSAEVLSERMLARQKHYMPSSLLQSQLDTLEPPGADEQAISIDIAFAPEQILAQALRHLEF